MLSYKDHVLIRLETLSKDEKLKKKLKKMPMRNVRIALGIKLDDNSFDEELLTILAIPTKVVQAQPSYIMEGDSSSYPTHLRSRIG